MAIARNSRFLIMKGLSFFLICAGMVFMLQGCENSGRKSWNPKLTTEYHAVFLNNGQVYFGKIQDLGSEYIQLTDVFYIRSEVIKDASGKEVKEVKNILIKRGSEGHGPDRMYLNSRQVTLIEPVSPDSRVAQLIKDAKK